MQLENVATIPRSELILGRANCPAASAVGEAVYITLPKVGNRYQVDTADPDDPTRMPAVGIIISKESATECVVQFHGPLRGVYTGLIPGSEYVVGTDGVPTAEGSLTYPTPGGLTQFQQLGVATDEEELLLHPQKTALAARGGSRYFNQPLTGAINGVNTAFTTALPFVGSGPRRESLHYNGQRLYPGVGCDYLISESVPGGGFDTITVAFAPKADDVLTVDFDPDI